MKTRRPRTSRPHGAVLALVSVCLGFFVIQLDATIVNVALPAIQREIGGSLAGLQWVIDAYTLALASIMLTAGAAADRIGARKIFVLGLATFAVGSAACAAAPALSVLIAARVLQGLGASALLPCSLALLVHQFPDSRARARALGVWGAMGSLGVAAGPVAGGALVALAGWRSIFVVNVPLPDLQRRRRCRAAVQLGLVRDAALPVAVPAGCAARAGAGHRAPAAADERRRRPRLAGQRQADRALRPAAADAGRPCPGRGRRGRAGRRRDGPLVAGHARNLHVPLAVATAGYLIATAVTWFAIRDTGEQNGR